MQKPPARPSLPVGQGDDGASDVLGQLAPFVREPGQFFGDGCGGNAPGGLCCLWHRHSTGCGGRVAGGRTQGGQALDIAPQVVHADVGVDVHRQVDGAVTGQSLGVAGVHTGSGQVRNKRMPQPVQMDHAAAVVFVVGALYTEAAAARHFTDLWRDLSDVLARSRWYRDIVSVFDELDMAFANWDYRRGFGPVDADGHDTRTASRLLGATQ